MYYARKPAWLRWRVVGLLPALVLLFWQTATTAQAQTAQTIVYGETATGEVVDRLGDEWVFTGCLNDQVTVTMQSDAFGAYLELYGPPGTTA